MIMIRIVTSQFLSVEKSASIFKKKEIYRLLLKKGLEKFLELSEFAKERFENSGNMRPIKAYFSI